MKIKSPVISRNEKGDIVIFREDSLEIIIPKDTFENYKSKITINRLSGADDYLNQMFEIDLPESIEVIVMHWCCEAIQEGKISELGEVEDIIEEHLIEIN